MRKLRNAFAICCILVSFFQETVHANPLKPDRYIALIVKSSSDSVFQSNLTIHSPQILKAILNNGVHKKTNQYPISDIYLIVDYNGLSKTYMIDRFVNLFDEQLIELPRLGNGASISSSEKGRKKSR